MADETPKDYSNIFCEDVKPPVPSLRGHNKQHRQFPILEGARSNKQIESTIDLREVVAKLQSLPRVYAMNTLNEHYSSYRRKKSGFKAYVQYYDEKDTYVVRVDSNTLKAIRDKLPKIGNYRYFFKQLDNTCEEVESENSLVPYHEKEDSRMIYCHIFPKIRK